MPKPFEAPPLNDDWEEHRRRVIGLGENSFRKSYYPELRRNITNVKNLVLAVDQSPRGIFICVRGGGIEYVNSTLLRLSGCHSDDLIGHTPHALWTNVVQGDGCDVVMQMMAAGVAWRGDLFLRDPSGQETWVSMSIAPIHDDTGDLTHFLGSMEDISMRKRVEAELKAVAQARAQALAATEHLSALKSEFLANMSHELRTPIFQILALARMGAQAKDGDKARTFAQKIVEPGERLQQIVTAVLDFSEIESGRMTVAHEPFAPLAMAVEVGNRWLERIKAKGLAFELDLTVESFPEINGDCKRLQQVLDELLTNALKFTAHGSIKLSVHARPAEIEFAVHDTGLGMSAEQLLAGLKPFQQLDGSATRRVGGLGLGLALAKHLMELMGGRLLGQSDLGNGTVFQAVLPIDLA